MQAHQITSVRLILELNIHPKSEKHKHTTTEDIDFFATDNPRIFRSSFFKANNFFFDICERNFFLRISFQTAWSNSGVMKMFLHSNNLWYITFFLFQQKDIFQMINSSLFFRFLYVKKNIQ